MNFDKNLVTLFKEVRNLDRLGLKATHKIRLTANEVFNIIHRMSFMCKFILFLHLISSVSRCHQARDVYPFATRLEELLRVYHQTCLRLDEQPELQMLVAVYKKGVQASLSQGMSIRWTEEGKKLKAFVDKLSNGVVELQDKVEELASRYTIINTALKELGSCEPSPPVLRSKISAIQGVIDALDRQGTCFLTYRCVLHLAYFFYENVSLVCLT